MLSLIRLAYTIALRRILASWRLELVLFLGMALAVALMSSSVIFSDLVAEAALRHALHLAAPDEANFSVRTFRGRDLPLAGPGGASPYQASLDFIEGRVFARFQPYLRDRARLLETETFFFRGHPQLELDNNVRPRGKIQYLSGLKDPGRIALAQGRWPYAGSGGYSPGAGPLEVAVDTLGAELLQLGVGDEMEVFPAAGLLQEPVPMRVKIVGVFRRLGPGDEFWYGVNGSFSFKNDQWTIAPLFTTEEALLGHLPRVYSRLSTDTTWFFYLDRSAVRARDVSILQDTIRGVEYDVRTNLANSSVAIKLDNVLDTYQTQLLLARIPLFLMLFLVTGILTYYLALVSGLVVRSRNAEIAVLKSRGATAFQVGLLGLMEGLLLAVPAVALGPLVALAAVRVLGRVFFGLGGGQELETVPVSLSSSAFLLGLAGGLLAVGVLAVATLMAARQGMVEFRQVGAKPPRAPFIHRYYLDILLLALIGLLWLQVRGRGSFLVQPLGGRGLEIDYSLLLLPVLGLLALGLVVLRLFPMALGLLARATEPVGPSWLVHGLRHVSRDPIVPGVLVVLLMLAAALGIIGSAFSSTLERSQQDRALYAAGADLRIQHSGTIAPLPLSGISTLAEKLEGVDRAAEVHRGSGNITTTGFGTSGTLLAVDSERFADVAWFRDDFGGGASLAELVGRLAPDPQSPLPLSDGIPLPDGATALAVWAQPDRPNARLSLWARLQDAQGYYFDIDIGVLDFRGWQRLEGELVPLGPSGLRSQDAGQLPPLSPPFTLLSLHTFSLFSANEPGILFLGRVAAITPEGETVIADFQDLDGWHVLEDHSRPGLYALESTQSVALPGTARSAAFSWAPGGSGLRGIRAGAPEPPLPALVSRSFAEVAQAGPGDVVKVGAFNFVTLPFELVGVVDYFPTLVPDESPFVVVDLKALTHYVNLHSQRLSGGSNELWVDTPGPSYDNLDSTRAVAAGLSSSLEERGLRVRETHIAPEMVSRQVEQPLVNAGWGGLIVLMFLSLVLASTSGVMLFSYTDTRERQTEFALLRTLGSSRGQLNGVVWFNIFLVVVCGVGLGTWAGQQVGASLLPLLEVAEEGSRVTPPMVLQANWVTLATAYLVLAGVTVGTVVWLAWFTAKMEVQRVLRIGDA